MRLTDAELERLATDNRCTEIVQAMAKELLERRARAASPKVLAHVLTRGAELGRGLEALMDYLNEGRLP